MKRKRKIMKRLLKEKIWLNPLNSVASNSSIINKLTSQMQFDSNIYIRYLEIRKTTRPSQFMNIPIIRELNAIHYE